MRVDKEKAHPDKYIVKSNSYSQLLPLAYLLNKGDASSLNFYLYKYY